MAFLRTARVFAALLAGVAVAEVPKCANNAQGKCLAAAEEDGSLAMLQHNAKAAESKAHREKVRKARLVKAHRHNHTDSHGKRQLPNTTAVWNQLKGAVDIDDLEQKLTTIENSEEAQKLQAKLDTLKEEFPSASEIKEEFSSQWDQVKEAVTMDNITSTLKDVTGMSQEQVDELQAQYEELKAKIPDLNITSIQNQAAEEWQKLSDQGLVPDIDDLQATAEKYYGQAKDLASSALDSAQEAASDALGSITDAFGWR